MVSKQGTATPTTYGYAYDGFSRLKEGIHTNNLNEKLITYDANGNITALTRQGGTNPGTFTYTYNGNKLTQLKIGTTAYNYAYDANGNTTTDGMRGFTMTYNLLNLPKRVSKGADYLDYVYDAGGNKLAKKKNNAFTQFYTGSIVYKADKTLDYVTHGEGLVLNVSGAYNYQYNINDHLGNTRVVQNATKAVEQRNDYYPFGLTHASPSNLQKNKYLYNGKEYQDETLSGTLFGQLDYGARFYDPVIARWQVVDPLATKYYNYSVYNYCFNSPLRFIDPNGMEVIDSNGIYAKLKKDLNDLLLQTQNMMKEGGFADVFLKALGDFAKAIKNTLKEYEKLETSKQVYRVEERGEFAKDEGGTAYIKGDIVVAVGKGSSKGILGHELKHAYQYEVGKLSFRTDNSGEYGVLYDLTDETEAYNRESLLNNGVTYFTIPQECQITNEQIEEAGKKYNLYQGLSKKPIDINSKQGKKLRQEVRSGNTKEVYNGYLKDLKKGQKK